MKKTTVKKQLWDILLDVNVAKIAQRYFQKSPSWLYHKLDGVDGNKKPTDFSDEELETLQNGLYDLSERIRLSAEKLNVRKNIAVLRDAV